jgi:hypothetical protein
MLIDMKMKRERLSLVLSAAALMSILIVSFTSAPVGAAGSVWTEDLSGSRRTYFNFGEIVVISWRFERGLVWVFVTSLQTNVTVDLGNQFPASGSTTFNPPAHGNYKVDVVGVEGRVDLYFAVCMFIVAPEVPMGIVAITVVGLLGLAVFRRFRAWG